MKIKQKFKQDFQFIFVKDVENLKIKKAVKVENQKVEIKVGEEASEEHRGKVFAGVKAYEQLLTLFKGEKGSIEFKFQDITFIKKEELKPGAMVTSDPVIKEMFALFESVCEGDD
jgi:hypothetical protein